MFWYDILAIWLGRIILVSVSLAIIALSWWLFHVQLFQRFPAYRFALLLWITQQKNESMVRHISMKNGDVWEIRKIK